MKTTSAKSSTPPQIADPASAGSPARYLVARVGREQIALPVSEVVEVIDAPEIAAVPLAPAALLGQSHWRGGWIPVLDPHDLLGIPRTGADDAAHATHATHAREVLPAATDATHVSPAAPGVLLVVRDAVRCFALRVDEVDDVIEASPDAIRAVPPGGDRTGRLAMLLRSTRGLVAVVDSGALRRVAEAILQEGEQG